MTQIITLSGRKQSGKNMACNFILGYCMSNIGVVKGAFDITKEGKLHVTDLLGDPEHEGIFDYFRQGKAMDDFKAKYLDKYIKIYSFADILKRDVCMNILGLTYDQVYGTDADKNTPTTIKWSDCIGVVTKPLDQMLDMETFDLVRMQEVVGRLGKYYDKLDNVVYHEDGFMTAREVMQFVGTEFFRKLSSNCWAGATLRRIANDNPAIALICDCRFPNEVTAVQAVGGVVVRLLRNSDVPETHASETALDTYEGFDFVLDNRDISIEQGNQQIYDLLVNLGLVQERKSE